TAPRTACSSSGESWMTAYTSVPHEGRVDAVGVGGDASGEVARARDAETIEHHERVRRAHTRVAVEHYRPVAGEAVEGGGELAQGDEFGARDACDRRLPWLADVDELHGVGELGEALGGEFGFEFCGFGRGGCAGCAVDGARSLGHRHDAAEEVV